ncbi:MAG TPA: zinc-ribbon domain-containing protein [Candidatus Nanoarchaeia archaeon]|nr:zinc-ribbon domain-containing protein [Candidatus Nanoarchaeia archaeon]
MKLQVILFVLCITLFSNLAWALDYSVTINSPLSVNAYEGEISNQLSATIKNNAGICDITCDWVTTAGQGTGIKIPHDGGTNTFNFDAKAEGSNGIATSSLIITCKRLTSISCWTEGEQQTSYPYTFRYLWNSDGICTPKKEKCDNYLSFVKDNACSCSPGKECKPNGGRTDLDEKGCQTYCGNKIIEKQYENCNNCQDDIGKCDGTSCIQGSECEGKHCVHNVCDPLPYRVGDSYCDRGVGETCKNSGSDCACEANQRCSNSGVCETFCGNGICETSEQGICKADCKWCGDSICESSESCSSCDIDCGACKKTTKEKELQRNAQNTEKNLTKDIQSTNSSQQTPTHPTIIIFGKSYSTSLIINISVTVTLLLALTLFLKYKYFRSKVRKDDKEKTTEPINNKGNKEHNDLKIPRCGRCNKKLDEDSKFCHHCGHKLN